MIPSWILAFAILIPILGAIIAWREEIVNVPVGRASGITTTQSIAYSVVAAIYYMLMAFFLILGILGIIDEFADVFLSSIDMLTKEIVIEEWRLNNEHVKELVRKITPKDLKTNDIEVESYFHLKSARRVLLPEVDAIFKTLIILWLIATFFSMDWGNMSQRLRIGRFSIHGIVRCILYALVYVLAAFIVGLGIYINFEKDDIFPTNIFFLATATTAVVIRFRLWKKGMSPEERDLT